MSLNTNIQTGENLTRIIDYPKNIDSHFILKQAEKEAPFTIVKTLDCKLINEKMKNFSPPINLHIVGLS